MQKPRKAAVRPQDKLDYAFAECYAATRGSDGGNLPLPKCVQAHNQLACREVVEQLKGKVFSISWALLGNTPEAEVVAQKVFARLHQQMRQVARQQNLITYTYRLAID